MKSLFPRSLALATFSALWALLPVPAAEPPLDQTARPEPVEGAPLNIVLIAADDLGYNELGCYGQKIIRTPHIDRIAAEGIKFTNFYSAQAVCAPARCGLMTGKHMGHATIRNNGNPRDGTQKLHPFPGQLPIRDEDITLAELLKSKDYRCGGFGKWGLGHIGTSGDPANQGFDTFFGFICQVHAHNHYPKFLWKNDQQIPQPGNDRTLHGDTYSQDEFMNEGLAFMKETHAAGKPMFAYFPFAIPHLSIQAPPASVDEYTGEIEEEEYVHKGYLPHPTPRAGYAAMVTHMDKGVGQILDLLEELGIADNTLILFTSDNGPTFRRLGGSDSDFFESAGVFKGLKGDLYEGGIRVPLVARWPGHIPPGTTTDHIAAWYDILPTLCDAAGVKTPADIDGTSFLPTLLGKPDEQKPHDFLYWEFTSYGGQQAVRMGKWKGIRRDMIQRHKKGQPIVTELYNLDTDPGESTDLADQNPAVLKKIETIMRNEHTPSTRFPFPALDN
jgi:arylsulfatase A-like enzyme